MSVQQALLFLNAVRQDETIRAALIERQDEIGLDDLLAIGGARGLVFDIADLREAFRHDWALRALRMRRGSKVSAG